MMTFPPHPTPATLARRRVWHHNSFFGHVGMARSNMLAISVSPTTTDESRELALTILAALQKLNHSLKTRRKPPT